MLHAGEVLMSNDYFACFSCHQQGDQKPEGPPEGWAPDLELAKDRLNPEWVVKWIEEPQKMMPGTRMPSFYPGGPDDILDANEPLQMEAMRDYIWTLGQPQMAKLAQLRLLLNRLLGALRHLSRVYSQHLPKHHSKLSLKKRLR